MLRRRAADQQAFWNDLLTDTDASADVLCDHMERAQEQFPELVAAFALTLAYVGHLHQHLHETSPGYPLPEFPEGFCERAPLLCQCADGSVDACKIIGAFQSIDPPESSETCDELWKRYVAALEAERRAWSKAVRERPSIFDPDPNRLPTITIKESERLLQELRHRRCLIPISLE